MLLQLPIIFSTQNYTAVKRTLWSFKRQRSMSPFTQWYILSLIVCQFKQYFPTRLVHLNPKDSSSSLAILFQTPSGFFAIFTASAYQRGTNRRRKQSIDW
ncbi:hypothetical protein DSO57_1019499 [Entomophthora muscae]|uniref:Uncharacterized protein n=1 Tax=Entomophthora muscae TaxID=34485 RepID=A0ACC2ST58_9FUNG|nr:hypothetical protein DSO57_1019499 [Entomophthora muscae]